MHTNLTDEEKVILLKLARESLNRTASRLEMPEIRLDDYSDRLTTDGATFVTLTIRGELRGCIGALEAYQPLIIDVCEHAAAAASRDFRFPPVTPGEVPEISIEISILSTPERLDYQKSEELSNLIRPFVDGVIIRDGYRKATFLPQVWEKLPEVDEFLDHLCLKMGATANLWRKRVLDISVYQVEEFHE